MEILVNTIFRKGIQIGPDPCQNGCCDGVTTIGNGYVVTDAVCACTFGFKDGKGTVGSWSDLAQKVYENGGSCWTGSGGISLEDIGSVYTFSPSDKRILFDGGIQICGGSNRGLQVGIDGGGSNVTYINNCFGVCTFQLSLKGNAITSWSDLSNYIDINTPNSLVVQKRLVSYTEFIVGCRGDNTAIFETIEGRSKWYS